MQTLINEIKSQVETFVEQRKNLILLLACQDNEAGMILQTIQDIEQASPSDLYFFFSNHFNTLDEYVDNIIEQLFAQYDLTKKEAENENLNLFPPPPNILKTNELTSIKKLGRAMMYTRSIAPNINHHRVVWALFPQAINNRKDYHELIQTFSPKNGIQDSTQGLRIIFRDLPDTLAFSPEIQQLPRLQIYQANMSPDAIQDSLNQNIHNENLPDEERFSAMLQYAMIDSAHGRFKQAYEYLKYTLGYYQQTNNYALQAVTINAMGDIYQRQQQNDKAIHVYETAIEPAVKSKSAVILHNVVSNLADSEFSRKNYTLAAKYYDQTDQLASKMLYADGKLRALNQQAECAIQQKDYPKAITYWEKSAALCRHHDYKEDLINQLKKLLKIDAYLPDNKKQAYQHELSQLTK